MSAVVYARLRVTDPGRWWAAALSWRRWAAVAGVLAAEFEPLAAGLRAIWSGPTATAAGSRLRGLRRRLTLFRLFCWRADQALSEFAAALDRARALLDRARTRAEAAGLIIDDTGTVRSRSPESADSASATTAGSVSAAAGLAAADLAAALTVAAGADESAAARLHELSPEAAAPQGAGRPGCTASPAEVRRWWAGLTPAERNWLLVTEPGPLGSTDGIPIADRDLANRLLLPDHRAGTADRGLRDGLDELDARLGDDAGRRAYLVGLDVAGEGRAVVALGDPDRSRSVLTHVPGMTSGLASIGGELTRAGRVADRAAELGPASAASAVLWLDYDAPDFLDEAFSDRQAIAGAAGLRRFQEGLRVTHEGPAAVQTVLGHSYGSLVVGEAATGPLEADRLVFVGSPGVGVRSAEQLSVPADQVWSSTSRTDVIQYAALAPAGLARDLAISGAVPVVGPAFAFGRPERDLWFGTNPSDPAFGGRVFASQPEAGHLGYWEPGRPALDALATLALGDTPAEGR
ncbi:alpha/beta hydrolase [Actinoplanes sp. NBRC 101535]|uniref:alpha/beta hydrolase n=1 Tax=Actinoplanes sp. NBRC 101535 TaxID=3032196 RepID=UPI0024A05EDE|nr:alpha/beta hydrolase [Actinoplanes sp. NBRC 101535]GLY00877.1 hypothetical protein Acsp01_12560 [Actinoplanes sp. NBRC 101535]